MSAYNDMDQKLAGMTYGEMVYNRTESPVAQEAIQFGDAVFMYSGSDLTDGIAAYTVKRDTSTITLDADLVTSNVITTTITVNGVAQAAVATTFITDHDTTMDTHLAALEVAITGLDVTLTDATNNRQFTLLLPGSNINTITSPVTAGGSQAGVVIAYTTSQIFEGVARRDDRSTITTVGQYDQYDAVSCLVKGGIYVLTDGAIVGQTPAYIVLDPASADQGKWTDTASGNYSTGCYFRENSSAAGLVLVEVNGLKVGP